MLSTDLLARTWELRPSARKFVSRAGLDLAAEGHEIAWCPARNAFAILPIQKDEAPAQEAPAADLRAESAAELRLELAAESRPARKLSARIKAASPPPAEDPAFAARAVACREPAPASAATIEPARDMGEIILQIGARYDAIEPARMWAGQFAKRLGLEIWVCDAASGEIRERIGGAKAKAAKASRPAGGARSAATDRMVECMTRAGGATLDEIATASGWSTRPGRNHLVTLSERRGFKLREIVGKNGAPIRYFADFGKRAAALAIRSPRKGARR